MNNGKAFARNVKRIRIQFKIDCNMNMNRDDEEIKAILRKARQRRRDERNRWRPFPF